MSASGSSNNFPRCKPCPFPQSPQYSGLVFQHPDVATLANRLIAEHLLPSKAAADARHVAVSAVFGVEYLLTWNYKHIANAEMLPRIYSMLRDSGFEPPLIVTPEEFSGDVWSIY